MRRSIAIVLFYGFTYRPIRGLPAVVAGAGPAHAFYFASYEYSKEIMSKVAPHRTNVNYSEFI